MSFLRHEQIYQSDVLCSEWQSEADCGFALPHRLDESATGYSSASCTPALLASASPDDSHGERRSRNCKPPLGRGWGIFSWRFGEFSIGVDTKSACESGDHAYANFRYHVCATPKAAGTR